MAARDSPSVKKRRSSLLVSPPPGSSLPIPQSTPDGALKPLRRGGATLTEDGSPLPRSKKTSTADPSFSSFNPQSPTLTSSYLQEDGNSFVTPAPPRVHPRLAPPSTAQRPSQHMPTSSPAPFWRYADIGSTPLGPSTGAELGVSPSKAAAPLPPQSSSPLRGNKSPPSSPTRPHKEASPERSEQAAEDEEEQAFDLTKYVVRSFLRRITLTEFVQRFPKYRGISRTRGKRPLRCERFWGIYLKVGSVLRYFRWLQRPGQSGEYGNKASKGGSRTVMECILRW